MDTEPQPAPESLFRPVKRRKFLRRRPDHEQEDIELNDDSGRDTKSSTSQTPQEIDDVVRLRRPQRTRKGGIEFSTTGSRQTADNDAQAVAQRSAEETEDERLRAMCDRFTAHTGQTVDVDKHMMDYIETEMAKRYRRDMPKDTSNSEATANEAICGSAGSTNFARREPATLGKLHEIDLGQETKLQNIARTEAATRRLAGSSDETAATPAENASEKTAVEQDRKTWRDRKGRSSRDIERDRLVEEVLRESKLDVYDEPDDEPRMDDMAADDRIAEQFRRDFMDAIQSRRRVARQKNTTTAKAAKPEATKGPKLGGSRSARAAMRESQKTQK
ncbi:telomere length and silencing 1 family protein [Aspergillus chevalieri]|uniref:Hepatocellular carcinoma-associated antigen 59-domain-containing protein n=1 Tax=Aspergillus chevalieri TaxID=182096 RepID=A0A7R7VY45_ASPCH|nr:uncharacterized protein ACHE_80249S [Aspergillus chevalieri]BCR92349.1 hypothetical protein ACHE_80249S [Aspergillus chevalieri]